MKTFYVYIMASHRRVIYTGVTSTLELRVSQHKHDAFGEDSFTARYKVHKLVYFETFDTSMRAMGREKEIKGWHREKRLALIERQNPKWHDLSAGWGKPLQVPPLPVGFRRNDLLDGIGFRIRKSKRNYLVELKSADKTNRLSEAVVLSLTAALRRLADAPAPLIITGNQHFFSAGADLKEIAALTAPAAYEFARMGQHLMRLLDDFPAPVIAAISGYCMGGGLDLALACDRRIAAPNAIFGHRGAALGLMTGWGGTQRLPRLIGKARALQLFVAAEKIHAQDALRIGLVDEIAADPIAAAVAASVAAAEFAT